MQRSCRLKLRGGQAKTRKTLSCKARWSGKTTRLDRKCFKQEVVPGFFQSSQATVLELWASPEVLEPPGTLLDTSCSHTRNAQGTQKQKTTTLDRKMPQAFSRPRPLLELSGHHSRPSSFARKGFSSLRRSRPESFPALRRGFLWVGMPPRIGVGFFGIF